HVLDQGAHRRVPQPAARREGRETPLEAGCGVDPEQPLLPPRTVADDHPVDPVRRTGGARAARPRDAVRGGREEAGHRTRGAGEVAGEDEDRRGRLPESREPGCDTGDRSPVGRVLEGADDAVGHGDRLGRDDDDAPGPRRRVEHAVEEPAAPPGYLRLEHPAEPAAGAAVADVGVVGQVHLSSPTSSPAATAATSSGTTASASAAASEATRCEADPPAAAGRTEGSGPPSSSTRTGRYWRRPGGQRQETPARARASGVRAGSPSIRRSPGATWTWKDTMTLTGLPGSAKTGTRPPSTPNPWGLPGCIATVVNPIRSANAALTTSFVPTLTPPDVTSMSIPGRA